MSFREAAQDFREKMLRFRYKDDPEKLAEELAKLREKRTEQEQRRQNRREQVAAETRAEDNALETMTLDELELLRRKTERELVAMEGSLKQRRELVNDDESSVGYLGQLIMNDPMVSESSIREKHHYIDKIEIAIQRKQPKPEAPPTPPTREEEQAQKYAAARAKREAIGKNRKEEVQRARDTGESEEQIRRLENRWDDAERQAEEEMRRYMV